MQPPVAITVHDASPATLAQCRELLAMLDDAGASPLTLLVVPHYHYHSAAWRSAPFLRAMEARLARGDELVLHGLFHLDDAIAPATARSWFERRVLTRSEGEFAALDEAAAAWRLVRGIAFFASQGWPLAGFVAPAWLMSPGTRRALSNCGQRFDYTTARSGVYLLPEWRFERTANLCYSPDSALRRAASGCVIARELHRARRVPLLRFSLHPQDARVPAVMRHWRRLVDDALRSREAVTLGAWARRVRAQDARRAPPSDPRRPCANAPAGDAASPAHAAS